MKILPIALRDQCTQVGDAVFVCCGFRCFRMLPDLLGAQSGRKSKLVEDRYIVLCTVTINRKPNKTPRTKNTKNSPKHKQNTKTQTKTNKPKENTHHRAVRMNSPEGGKGLLGGANPAWSFNMFGACCKLEVIDELNRAWTPAVEWPQLVEDRYLVLCTVRFHHQIAK